MKNPILKRIQEHHKGRSFETMDRRIIKLFEEAGELSQAFLAVTSSRTSKKDITLADLREEMVDTFILITDIMFTPLPCDAGKSPVDIEDEILEIMERKLEKWAKAYKVNEDESEV